MNILVADAISPAAVKMLQAQAGWNVILSSPKEFTEHLAGSEAMLIRSGVKVTAEVLAKATRLRVIGRAGSGVDNIDMDAATANGVVVMNTPGGNANSVAEHTLALILAVSRSIAQASASTKAGRWEKKRFLGNEIGGKTLGIVGLGNIGMQVALRARPFGMKILAHDPFVSRESAKDRGVEIVELDELYAASDFISLHVSLTPQTHHMLGAEAFAKMKQGVRIVNCARGELIDTEALREALDAGKVAAAALDVFSPEPPPADSPLLRHDNVIATPHIGGSTEEAQETVGIRIAEQVRDYLKSGVVTNAVNMPSISAEQYGSLRPYLVLAERLGSFVAQIATGPPKRVKVIYSGVCGESNSSLLRNAALAGILNRFLSQKANLINAAQVADSRGLGVSEIRRARSTASDTMGLILETEDGERQVEGAVFAGVSPRLISVDGIFVETPLNGHMVFLKNNDVPGVIGRVGTILGDNTINIADFSLGRRENHDRPDAPAEAVAVVRIDEPLPQPVLEQLAQLPAVNFARLVELPAQD